MSAFGRYIASVQVIIAAEYTSESGYLRPVSCTFEQAAGGIGLARERYSRDYRITEKFDEKGRVHVDYEYIGEDYRFAGGEKQLRRERRTALVLCAAGWAAYIAALLPRTEAMHRLYIALPFIFLAVPLAMYADFYLAFVRMPEVLEHRHADRLNNRYPFIAFLLTVFSLIPAAAESILLFTGSIQGGFEDIFFLLCAILLFCIGAYMFRNREKIAAVPCGKKTAAEDVK